jgi:hypothetical protein
MCPSGPNKPSETIGLSRAHAIFLCKFMLPNYVGVDIPMQKGASQLDRVCVITLNPKP